MVGASVLARNGFLNENSLRLTFAAPHFLLTSLNQPAHEQIDRMMDRINAKLAAWNEAREDEAVAALLHCCAARRWAHALAAGRPFASPEALYTAADAHWARMESSDWLEAFRAHPRIGERKPAAASAQSKAWSSQEQAQVHEAQRTLLAALAQGNEAYEARFGFTYIVCATGKSAQEMLAILNRRLTSEPAAELGEAAEQQRQITQIRLRKWLEA